MKHAWIVFGILLLWSCNDAPSPSTQKPLFTRLSPAQSGVDFRNDLVYDRDFNIYRYRNFYNGGGVAIGDVNNDGLPDLFFTSNMAKNKLYLNRGNLKFEDVSDKAGISGKGSWATGVAMVDINADNRLDIYVCNSGNPRSDEKTGNNFNRDNELFINNGDGTFSEQAAAYGLNDPGLTTHTAFFDYDGDGDLDAYILNNSFRPIGSFDLRRKLRNTRDSLGGHKLLRNNAAQAGATTFSDVSSEAGILGSVIAFGLGVTVGDIDMDGKQDIYVSNDFFERDYLYHNQGDGTFSEQLEKSMRHISAASMGADMADINNDAFPDIFVTDMLPEPDRRIKTTTSFDSPDRLRYTQSCGYYNQFTRNMLHLNNGDGSFSEIACLAGVEATDWSWGALMMDMDNDGWRDLFVANGIAQDLTNQDYLMFASDPNVQQAIIGGGQVDFKRLIDSIPSEKVPNYAFKNLKNLRFSNETQNWGLSEPSFSNGSAYGDLDNDGDLDLVVNNANMEAFVYRNEAREQIAEHHFLRLQLRGEGLNTQALGAKVFLRAGGQTLYQEQMPMRGFQSSMDPRPHFGLGNITMIDSVVVIWPGHQKATVLTQVKADQELTLDPSGAQPIGQLMSALFPQPRPLLKMTDILFPFQHQENTFYDWDRDRLLYFLYSTESPRSAVADVNGDGLEDIYICAAAGQSGALLLQKPDGNFSATAQPAFQADAACEDSDAAFLDADGDGDQDLYVGSGSNEFEQLSAPLADRLYLNDGKGRFTRKKDALPGEKPFATGCVRPADADGDGDQDVFVGMRLLPGKVGVPVSGFLLLNDGKGFFNMTQPPALKNLGLITDAAWSDLDGDRDPDLLVCGEWMALRAFRNEGNQLTDATEQWLPGSTRGLWKRLHVRDLNADGKADFVVGNMGLNTRLDAGAQTPLTLIFNDFDQNGTPEQLLCRYNEGLLLPFNLRGDLLGEIPILKKKYLHYRNYAGQTPEKIFKPEQLQNAVKLEVNELQSGVWLSQANGKWAFAPLPSEAQFAPIFGIAAADINGDGHTDLMTAGNFHGAKPEFGHTDADYGLLLLGDGKGDFKALRSKASGLRLEGEIRDIARVKSGKKTRWIALRNNGAVQAWE